MNTRRMSCITTDIWHITKVPLDKIIENKTKACNRAKDGEDKMIYSGTVHQSKK